MKVGVPKEIKTHEYRVGLTPASARELVQRGHSVIIETQTGAGIGYSDEDYLAVGAKIVATPQDVFQEAELIVKVKEPQPVEYGLLRPQHVLFTYLHLAADKPQAEALINSDCVAIAYETVTNDQKGLPLLTPMSEVAGRLAIQVGAHALEKAQGGCGILLGGVPGVEPAKVVVLGGGVVGVNAAWMAVGIGAHVVILDRSLNRLRELNFLFGSRAQVLFASTENIEKQVKGADLVVGAVLLPGAEAPRLVTRSMLREMREGSVLVDVSIDQGGCFETSRPTTHANPTYVVDGVIHYCVTNMPSATARTSAQALNNATLPFILELAGKGYMKALQTDLHLQQGLNVYRGIITHPAVAASLGYPYKEPAVCLNA